MTTPADRTEERLRAALVAVAPENTRLEAGLADLEQRLSGPSPAPVPLASRRPRPWLAAVAAVVVVLLGLGAAVILSGGGVSDGGRGSVPTTANPSNPEAGEAARLQFRPVLAVDTCDALLGPAPDAPAESTGVTCYESGPVAADGTDLQDAEPAFQEDWVVNVRARPDAVDRLNAMFDACYRAEASCPPVADGAPGAIAVVWRGVVIMAPAVNGPDLADDVFTLSGNLDEASARELADAINAG